MVVYVVHWSPDKELIKGKGRLSQKEHNIIFSVLCRNAKDAISCLRWVFDNEYDNLHNLELDDGVYTLRRSVVDSRNINFRFIYMDGIKRPLSMSDFNDSITQYSMRYFRY